MAEFNQERAIARYTDLMRLTHAGGYDERKPDGSYGADGIEESIDALEHVAAQHALEFRWHEERGTWSLEPLSSERKAAFLHVNVETLVSVLAETAQYLNSLPYESAMDQNARGSLNMRIEEAIKQSYRVLKEEKEAQS